MAATDEGGDTVAERDARFDASQYAFFGHDAMEDFELGGFEEDDAHRDANASICGFGDNEYRKDDVLEADDELIASLSDVDDLARTFSEINRGFNDANHIDVPSRGGSFSRESSSATDWAYEPNFSNRLDQQLFEAEDAQSAKCWWSHPHASDSFADSSFSRTSSIPQPMYNLGDTVHAAKPSPLQRTSTYPQQDLQFDPNKRYHAALSAQSSSSPAMQPEFNYANMPASHVMMPHMAPPVPNLGPNPHYPSFGRPRGPSFRPWMNRAMFPSEHPDFLPNQRHKQHLPLPNGMMPVHEQGGPRGMPLPHFKHMQAQMISPQNSVPQMIGRFDSGYAMSRFDDPRAKSFLGRQRFPHQGADFGYFRNDNVGMRFRFRYMSVEEIENIGRLQHAATHGNDPYIDDYYHQACLSKRSVSGMMHHFCPNFIRDPSSTRTKDEPHAYLQVEGLGRLPFSSIRRPRPLLDVELASEAADGALDQKSTFVPLEKEPMLTARIITEDCIGLVLDIDDIDRLLLFNQAQDFVLQLRSRREALLEEIVDLLQLVDPLIPNKTGQPASAPKDDLIFRRIISIQKGRKFLARFILLIPGCSIARVVCMAVFRHLRFLFGTPSVDTSTARATVSLLSSILACINQMDIGELSSCLAAIVCSSEQPPLRPLRSASGDGASVIIKGVLERATNVLSATPTANYSMPNRSFWQASFNAFFDLLTNYCISKYDGILQAVNLQAPNVPVVSAAEVSGAICKEMPVELLRASLPHTDEHQRKLLLDFAQRTVPVNDHSSNGTNGRPASSEFVLS